MVVIRLARGGNKHRPYFSIVAADSQKVRRDGRFIEKLGFFNPVASEGAEAVRINSERVAH